MRLRPDRAPGRREILTTGNRVPVSLLILGLLLVGLLVFPFLSMLAALPRAEHAALLSRTTLDATWTTLLAATVALAGDAALGIPLAYWLARTRSRWRSVVLVAALAPLALPPVVAGLELVLWLGPYGWLGKLLGHAGLNPLDSLGGTILAQMLVAAPFVIVAARAAFAGIDPGVNDAARSLGCGPWQALLRVALPVARRGIVAGLVLGWLRAVGEFGTSIIVAYHPYTLSNLTYVQLSQQGLRTALPTGALLGAFGVLAALVLLALDPERRRTPGAGRSFPARAAAWSMARRPAGAESGAEARSRGAEAEPARLAVQARGQVGQFSLDVDLEAPAAAVAILGPSGAGKSLTLRTMAGLLKPAAGRVAIGDRCLFDSAAGLSVPAERRQLGYVAQDGALFPHLDVQGNVGFGLAGHTRSERAARVSELLEVFGLTSLARARPATLSGGERQRVALARSLAPRPAALLLDEPFSSLDAGLRRSLRELVRTIHETTKVPVVLVTHDRDDALDVADYVVIMDGGGVLQQGRIEEVFAHPANRSVAQLVGIANVLSVSGLEPEAGSGKAGARTIWGAPSMDVPEGAAGSWDLAVPAEAVQLRLGSGIGVIAAARPGASDWRVWVRLRNGGDALMAVLPRNGGPPPAPGTSCDVVLDPARCHLMANGSPDGSRSAPS